MNSPKQLEEENRRLRERVRQLEQSESAPTNANIEQIKKAVCAHFGITKAALNGSVRTSTLARARHVLAITIKRVYPWISSVEIGTAMRRDHSTILTSLRRRGKDKDLQYDIESVIKRVEENSNGT